MYRIKLTWIFDDGRLPVSQVKFLIKSSYDRDRYKGLETMSLSGLIYQAIQNGKDLDGLFSFNLSEVYNCDPEIDRRCAFRLEEVTRIA